MGTVQPYTFEEHEVRVLLIDEEPWFVASDVCVTLGLANPTQAVSKLDDDEYRLISPGALTPDAPSGPARNVVNEAGLYTLIMRSKSARARPFRRWVTHEVLPAIRRTGTYTATMPRSLPEALRAYAAEVEAREVAEQRAMELMPKGEAFDAYLSADGAESMSTVAKMLSTGQNRLFQILRERGILIAHAGVRRNTPYQRFIEMGWFDIVAGTRVDRHGEEVATYTTRVRPKGVEGIRKLLQTT